MSNDLLQLKDHAPPMGDLALPLPLSMPRALWTVPALDEPAHPGRRIIHARTLQLHGRARLDRLGLRAAQGFHKCGSRQDLDWVTAFRLQGFQDGAWRTILVRHDLARPAGDSITWFELGGVVVSGAMIELRGCGTDEGWTPWNLAEGACLLEGELLDPIAPCREQWLQVAAINLSNLPDGVSAVLADGSVRYTTPELNVGFSLSRPGFSFLSLAGEDPALAETNTLFLKPGHWQQGPHLHEVGAAPAMDATVRFDVAGTVTVNGASVIYDFHAGGRQHALHWQVTSSGLRLHARRSAGRAFLAWQSTTWRIATRNSVTPSHTIGRILHVGEAGRLALPVLVNLPRFGTLQISSDSPATSVRVDAIRVRDHNLIELKFGEQARPDGTYDVCSEAAEASFNFTPVTPPDRLRADAPPEAHRAWVRTGFTALTYRPEMGTLSNNGASMPCAISMDTWSAYIFAHGEILPGFQAHELLRDSLERWLDGGQSYADGRLLQDGKVHDAQDEYLMTGAAALRGLADFLQHAAAPEWFGGQLPAIRTRLAAMRTRDLDGDGLIESAWRTGVSGTGQWSTCWFDVISFGWKDAFTNAILYPALRGLAHSFLQHQLVAEAADLTAWADRLEKNYLAAFLNPATGWLAGWRCKADRLHDYAFLMVNGCAINAGLVPAELARTICEGLLREMRQVGLPDAGHGLPGNLHPIPDQDLADILQGFPFGYYQNGGRTHAQARHFVMALYRCGLTTEADRLLFELCRGYAEARVFGGNQSGVDWRSWDDRPCGYEGLLTDQFGMLEVIFHRYGRR